MSDSFIHQRLRRNAGYTLSELMVALVIFALVASAVSSLAYASFNATRYVKASTDSVSKVELGVRRMIENLRSASWARATSSTQLFVDTQADPNNSNQVDHLLYQLTNGSLTETNTAYGTSPFTLADNVTAFSVQLLSTNPTTYQISVTVTPNNSNAVTRTVQVTCRNF